MNCNNCGGKLKYSEGIFLCENCGVKQSFEHYYENIDVFICYIENDKQGRRTKDSVIAQEIYHKLQNSRVNSFYPRISAEFLMESDYKKACEVAFNKAKIIIIVGTNTANFNMLLNKNDFEGKIIFPIYSTMNANDLPQKIVKLQALNYETLGVKEDLTRNVLSALGRSAEIDIASLRRKTMHRRKKIYIGIISSLLAILIFASVYIVFFTTLVLDSNKYKYAQELYEKGNYIQAINTFQKITDYKNSKDELKKIYDKFDGYYSNEEQTIIMHLNTTGSSSAVIEVIYYDDNGLQYKYATEASINGNFFEGYFIDELGNSAIGSVTLKNEGIKLMLDVENEIGIEDIDELFEFDMRSDAPIVKKINKSDVEKWLSKGLTKNELSAQGYELKFLEQLGNGDAGNLFLIENTDIKVEIGGNGDVPIVMSMSIPAEIIAPELIGKKVTFINKDGVLYIPYGNCAMGVSFGDKTGDIITKTTPIAVTSKSFCSNMNMNSYDDWDNVLLEMAYYESLQKDVKGRHPDYDLGIFFRVIAKTPANCLVYCELHNMNSYAFYKFSRNSSNFEFICEIPQDYLMSFGFPDDLSALTTYNNAFSEFID